MPSFTPKASGKPLCFVIGPIGEIGTDERRHADLLLNAVIRHVLEDDAFGYQVKRADEDSDPGMIGDRVVTDIINAKLVIADMTSLNVNAFYELGIRHSTLKPTIHIAKIGTVLPFDHISQRTIFIDLTDWSSILLGRTLIAESARATESPDFQVSNPITQANASFKMRESADPRDRIIAEIQGRLISLEGRLKSDALSTTLQAAGRTIDVDIADLELLNYDVLLIQLSLESTRGHKPYRVTFNPDDELRTLVRKILSFDPKLRDEEWIMQDERTQRVLFHFKGAQSMSDTRSLNGSGIKAGMRIQIKSP